MTQFDRTDHEFDNYFLIILYLKVMYACHTKLYYRVNKYLSKWNAFTLIYKYSQSYAITTIKFVCVIIANYTKIF